MMRCWPDFATNSHNRSYAWIIGLRRPAVKYNKVALIILPIYSPPMELRHLRYFVTVAEEGNFTRAALRLHMQQPPLSQQIRMLEEELGFVLFLRHPKGVDLSPAGKVYLQEARAILDRVKRAGVRAALTASGMEGLVSRSEEHT